MTAVAYRVIDADQHSMPPDDTYERYIDPKQRDKVSRARRRPNV